MKLAIGTAQFGMDYGISNKHGKIPLDEVRKIILLAEENGMCLIDTAALYGESEAVLGTALPERHAFNIVTKTPVYKTERITEAQGYYLNDIFHRSLERLRQDRLYGLLIHHVDDLLAPGGEHLLEEMRNLKGRGLVEKIGVSVYTEVQIDRVFDLFRPDIVQLPINLFDQRLIESGHLSKLKKLGVEIHARSIFLQGLLLMQPEELPPFFSPIYELVARYSRFLELQGLTRLQAALLFAWQQTEIDSVLVGVTNASELADIISASDIRGFHSIDLNDMSVRDETMITPSLWNL
jgi:aryl-alcohol dehydrogenase-like predicted oxidoreductase